MKKRELKHELAEARAVYKSLCEINSSLKEDRAAGRHLLELANSKIQQLELDLENSRSASSTYYLELAQVQDALDAEWREPGPNCYGKTREPALEAAKRVRGERDEALAEHTPVISRAACQTLQCIREVLDVDPSVPLPIVVKSLLEDRNRLASAITDFREIFGFEKGADLGVIRQAARDAAEGKLLVNVTDIGSPIGSILHFTNALINAHPARGEFNGIQLLSWIDWSSPTCRKASTVIDEYNDRHDAKFKERNK